LDIVDISVNWTSSQHNDESYGFFPQKLHKQFYFKNPFQHWDPPTVAGHGRRAATRKKIFG
jgi:hypothetical protein